METKRNHPMLDPEDLKWLATSATELNRLLQQSAKKAEQARLCKGEGAHLESLGEQLERASRASQAIFDRITTRSFASADDESTPKPQLTPMSASPANVSTEMAVGEFAITGDTESDTLILNPKGERELILVVDDDLEILERAGEILDFEDYRFVLAKDGIEALQIYRRMFKNIDLVLLDYFLPVMDGDAVFDELKAINPNVRVVLSSGFGEHSRVREMLSRGLSGFIPKPYTHEKLIEQIRSILEA
jgi:CheY-like chemotaxis protein